MMTLDDTDALEQPQAADDDALAAADGPQAAEAAPNDPAPRAHWDRVLAAVQERR